MSTVVRMDEVQEQYYYSRTSKATGDQYPTSVADYAKANKHGAPPSWKPWDLFMPSDIGALTLKFKSSPLS
jgi:hypothetical protein